MLIDPQQNATYRRYLQLASGLSGLFSSSDIPLIEWRLAEKIVSAATGAENIGDRGLPFDSVLRSGGDVVGVGVKTFKIDSDTLRTQQKVREVNKDIVHASRESDERLVERVVEAYNTGLAAAQWEYCVNRLLYHCIGRRPGRLIVFETGYFPIRPNQIAITAATSTAVTFTDGTEQYRFSRAKSVLHKDFDARAGDYRDIPVLIWESPLELLLRLADEADLFAGPKQAPVAGADFVVLPLYSPRTKTVPEKAQLNWWNATPRMAGGPERNSNDMYFPIPSVVAPVVHQFLPMGEFLVQLPSGASIPMRVGQSGGKGLMSTPNHLLGNWVRRALLQDVPLTEPLRYEHLLMADFDSVRIERDGGHYHMRFDRLGAYERFCERVAAPL